MEIAPLIHSRTFYRDFNQNFAVRPNDLNVQWAMNKILPAMRDVDILNGVRRVFATDGNICIAGIACNFRYFVENYLSADEIEDAKNFLHDERDREVKIFLGCTFKDNGVPDVSESKLWQMFKKYLAPEWNRKTVETIVAPYENCGVKNVVKKNLDKTFYTSGESTDIEIFEQSILARKNFCSNVDAVKIFESGEYEIITAPQNFINRFKSEAQKKTAQPQHSDPPRQEIPHQAPIHNRIQSPNLSAGSKKSSIPLSIIGAVIAVIIAVLFLVM